MGIATHDDEDGTSDEEKSDSDPEEAYTAVRSVVLIPKPAAEEAQENPKVAELKERLINAYPRLFSGVANKIIFENLRPRAGSCHYRFPLLENPTLVGPTQPDHRIGPRCDP